MSTDPDLLAAQPAPLPLAVHPAPLRRVPHRIPHLGHLLLFLAITGGAMLITQLLAVGVAQGLHLFPHEPLTEMARDPRLILPTMFLSYFVAGILSIVIFTAMWRLPFAEGVRWDLAPLRNRRWLLVVIGVTLSIVIQLLSNYLPIPKELPIDQFFRTPLDVWLVAFFGVFVAPVFEELAFRGFLLPALANAWDSIAQRRRRSVILDRAAFEHLDPASLAAVPPAPASPLSALAPLHDPAWSTASLIFASILTSICFALLHADQLAHAYAPLGVLFCVSLILCVVRLRWHSLAASALVHACYNGTIFAMLFVATSGFRHLERLKP